MTVSARVKRNRVNEKEYVFRFGERWWIDWHGASLSRVCIVTSYQVYQIEGQREAKKEKKKRVSKY
jgi:hypothetical protein